MAAAQGSGFPPLVAEVQYALGDAQAKAGSYAAAEQILREAFAGAEGGRIDELAERASLRLAQVIGGNQQRFGEASVWADLAAAKAERLGGRAELRGAVAYARAMLLQRQGRWTESLARCREALPLLESAHGAQSPRVAEVERLMGSLMLEDGNLDEARAHHQRAFAIWSAALGTSHPDVAMSLNSLGHVQAAAGDLEGAQQTHRRALAIARAALGDEHPYVANALHNVAMVALAMGNLDEAEASLVRALQIRIKAYGPDHPLTAGTQGTQGELAMRRGRPSEALELHQRSLAALQKTLPADHPGLAAPLIGIGLAQLELGATKPAREALEQALRLRSEHPGEPARLATARFALARILATEDLPRALALAQQAREGFASIKDGRAAEVERWISAP